MEINNRTVRLNKRPLGLPEKNTWSFNEENFDLKLNENQFIIKNDFISLDPAMRGWLNDARSYIKPVQVGEVMRAGSVGKVIKSNNKYFNKHIEIGGDQIVTYMKVLQLTAKYMNKRRLIFSIPFFSLGMSKLWVGLFSGSSTNFVAPLIESLRHDMTIENDSFMKLCINYSL